MAKKGSGKPVSAIEVHDANLKAAFDEMDRAQFGNVGGATRQKVELGLLIEALLKDIRAIDDNPELSRGEKTKRLGRLADKVKNRLFEDGRKKDDEKLKASSYRRYLTTIRNAITAQNWRHHAIEETCRRMAKHFPKYAQQLHDMAEIQDITPLRIAYRELKNQVKRDGDNAAYLEVKKMKLDHEIMRHLALPAVVRDQLGDHAKDVLEYKATNTITINYHWLVKAASELIDSRELRSDGSTAAFYSHLALGIAMATGRRAVEVLAQGRFKKVGEFEVEFSGQAKQRMGVDYSSSYRIYTLLSADVVIAAIECMRRMPEVMELQDKDNTEINKRTAKTLNTLAKRVFGDERRVFKDSRAIWARIVYEAHFKRDTRWKKVNDEVFWREMLGHEDLDTQESYKQFKIDYTELPEDAASVASKFATRLEALVALDDHPKIHGREAMEKIHRWVKETIKASPLVKISQKGISTNVGSYRPLIKEYLEIAGEALGTPGHSIAAVAAEVPAQVAKAKPHLTSHKNENGDWVAVASINGVELATAINADRFAAIREAFTLAEKA